MGTAITGMTMSLDGLVADQDGNVGPLYPDFAELQGTGYLDAAIAEAGAVLMGRRAFEMGDPDSYVGTYEFQVSSFVLTHHPPATPPHQDERLTFTFASGDVAAAVERAKTAGEKAAQVGGGPDVIGRLLRAGLVDELHIDAMPVLLGAGRRLFDVAGAVPIRIEKTGVEKAGQQTGLRFRVVTEKRSGQAGRSV